jgi:hypothetical protein
MNADSLHRLLKSLLDSGEATSIAGAEAAFRAYGVRIALPTCWDSDPAAQIIALTAINAASRSFLGHVKLDGDDLVLTVSGFEGRRLSELAQLIGLAPPEKLECQLWPTIAIGDAESSTPAIRPWAQGWEFGVGTRSAMSAPVFAPACVAAGGLAVSEAFSMLRADNPAAGHRDMALSLWNLAAGGPGPDVSDFDLAPLWIIGLGHLGQAYCWTLGFMAARGLDVVLQDTDRLTESSLSTCLLARPEDIGRRKTRIGSAWLEVRGVQTRLVERRFDEHQRPAASEPSVALMGVDNPATRRLIDRAGYRLVVDAGLGAGYQDFRAIRLRTFPGPSLSASVWTDAAPPSSTPLPAAYERLLADGADPCGVTTLASRAVGAPFVGCVAAGFALAEIVRRQRGGAGLGFVDVNLRDVRFLDAG